jgi:LmbE family N-acetylglucosaminyl deacetylase
VSGGFPVTAAHPGCAALPDGGVLVVAAHPDDAALSVGGTLPCLTAPLTLLTVFGRSNYTLQGGFERGWRRVTELRREEETIYARSIGARLLYPELTDASVRFRGAGERIFPPGDPPDGGVTSPRRLPAVLEAALDCCRPGLVLAPAGIGGHTDHLALREAARALAARRGTVLAFYEDLPYAATVSEPRLRRFLCRIDSRLEPWWIPLDGRLADKLEGLSIYASQLDAAAARAVAAHANRWPQYGPCERLWAAAPLPPPLVAARGRAERAGTPPPGPAPQPCA